MIVTPNMTFTPNVLWTVIRKTVRWQKQFSFQFCVRCLSERISFSSRLSIREDSCNVAVFCWWPWIIIIYAWTYFCSKRIITTFINIYVGVLIWWTKWYQVQRRMPELWLRDGSTCLMGCPEGCLWWRAYCRSATKSCWSNCITQNCSHCFLVIYIDIFVCWLNIYCFVQ